NVCQTVEERKALGEYGRKSRTPNTQSERMDEQGVEDNVEQHRHQHKTHGGFAVTQCPQHGTDEVVSEKEQHPQKGDLQVFTCSAHDRLRCTDQAEQGFGKEEPRTAQPDREYGEYDHDRVQIAPEPFVVTSSLL